jgi:hypothetical protein
MNDLLVDRILDVKMDVSRGHHMSDRLDDQNLDDVRHGLTMGDDLMTDVSHDLRKNDLLDDQNLDDVRRDRKLALMKDVSLYLRRNDLLDDHSMDDDHRDVLVGHCNYALDDQNLDVSHVNRNYARHDRNLDVSHANRNCVRRDRSLGVMMDGNLCRRMNDLLVDRNLDVMTDGNLYHRRNDPLDDHHDLNLVVKMGGMRHRVKLMVYLNRSCDRMSHDHLQYDRLMMRHRDTNRIDGKNLGGKMKIHHANHRMKVYRMRLHRENRLMTVCLKKI